MVGGLGSQLGEVLGLDVPMPWGIWDEAFCPFGPSISQSCRMEDLRPSSLGIPPLQGT